MYYDDKEERKKKINKYKQLKLIKCNQQSQQNDDSRQNNAMLLRYYTVN